MQYSYLETKSNIWSLDEGGGGGGEVGGGGVRRTFGVKIRGLVPLEVRNLIYPPLPNYLGRTGENWNGDTTSCQNLCLWVKMNSSHFHKTIFWYLEKIKLKISDEHPYHL